MAPTNGTSEEIIEKRDTSPIATACLVVSAVFIVTAIVFQIAEIAEIRKEYSASELEMSPRARASRDFRRELGSKIDKALESSTINEEYSTLIQDIVAGKPGAPGTLWNQPGSAGSGGTRSTGSAESAAADTSLQPISADSTTTGDALGDLGAGFIDVPPEGGAEKSSSQEDPNTNK